MFRSFLGVDESVRGAASAEAAAKAAAASAAAAAAASAARAQSLAAAKKKKADAEAAAAAVAAAKAAAAASAERSQSLATAKEIQSIDNQIKIAQQENEIAQAALNKLQEKENDAKPLFLAVAFGLAAYWIYKRGN